MDDLEFSENEQEICRRIIERLRDYEGLPNINVIRKSAFSELVDELNECRKLGLLGPDE